MARGRAQWWRVGLACAALGIAYVLVPVDGRGGTAAVLLRAVATLLLLAGIVATIGREVARLLHDPGARVGGLVVAVTTGVLFFALADYAIAFHRPGQFDGLHTRLDALYFALTTLLTVGFGDITPRGQLARGVVTAQLVFNVTLLAGSVSLLSRSLAARLRDRPERRRRDR